MIVRMEQAGNQAGYVVWLNQYRVRFNSQSKAEAFVAQLQARLQAPHPLPARGNQTTDPSR